MDLFAYAQIGTLEAVAKAHGIEVPRLRGYRLMVDEDPVSNEKMKEIFQESEFEVVQDLCRDEIFWSNRGSYKSYDDYTEFLCRHFIRYEFDEDGHKYPAAIRWDRIHGWKRKVLKFEIKKQKRRIREQYKAWNSYCGRDDVMYIHAKLGKYSWSNPESRQKVCSEPWFLEIVDDWWDRCYCDIYAKINPEVVRQIIQDQESQIKAGEADEV